MEQEKNQKLAEVLAQASEENRVANGYLFEGEDREKVYAIAKRFADRLVKSPLDLFELLHEKPNLISVEEVREGICRDAGSRPYGGGRKVYIIRDAEKMNEAAQNTLLKTLEEPPEFVTILLLTDNRKKFLPTVLSRVVKLAVNDTGEDEYDDPEYQELYHEICSFLMAAPEKNMAAMKKLAKYIADKKTVSREAADLLQKFLHDVFIFRIDPDSPALVLKNEKNLIRGFAEKMSFEAISKMTEQIAVLENRIAGKVDTALSFEAVFMALFDEL